MSGQSDKRDASDSAKSSYVITTKDGTSVDQFNSKVKGFDNGAGLATVVDGIDYQVYTTRLTQSQADQMKKIDCVLWVWKELDPDYENEDDSEDDRALPLHDLEDRDLEDRGLEDRDLEEHEFVRRGRITRKDSASQLRLISWNKPGTPQGDYMADDSLGKGSWIYIIDTGFNTQVSVSVLPHMFLKLPDGVLISINQDLAKTADRDVVTYVVNNEKMLPLDSSLTDASWRKPEDITDWSDHGTSVACVAGGLENGVASKANLFLAKAKNAWQKPGGKLMKGHYQLAALSDVFLVILGHVKANAQGKGIVNMSWGKPATQELSDLLGKFITDLEQLDASPVTSAGNDGDEDGVGLHTKTPTDLGTDDNALVTVGAVKPDGDLWKKTTPKQPGKGGSMTVYAQGSKVKTYNAAGVADDNHSGTSVASPAIAGLLAYYLGNSDFSHNFRQGTVAKDLKKFVADFAFQRVAKISVAKGYPRPASLDVGYNLMRGQAQQCKKTKKRDGSEPDCELEPVPYPSDEC
ncbi:subtilisin-like protein [Penicillium hispanicum]|uniref:subtilisin-like protein n=1 Tax=Penicillium hispanicum TaxID=1080232 RepID=UPI0025423F9A|nr:subtilisin-like protein [Penicillium hispanicum]KAJ5569959.1 subtilisin-like protein [Penicillium hispanicum]